MRILIIEDHREQAEILCKLLTYRMEFVECKIVDTLESGLRESVEFNADITILDLLLPDATRQQVLESIRRFPPPVIVVSALVDIEPEVAPLCWAYGAKGVLSKRGLLDQIESIQGIIQKARLIDAVTGSYLRHTAPAELRYLAAHGTS